MPSLSRSTVAALAFASLASPAGCSSKTEPAPAPSPMCTVAPFADGDDPCTAPLAPGSDRHCTFQFGGQKREFLLYAPPSFNACAPAAMVVDAHGSSENMRQHAGLEQFNVWPEGLGSGWRLVADREGFIVVTPQGIDDKWNMSTDVDFIVAVQQMVAGVATIDPKRVFLTGISNGGMLTYAAACGNGLEVFTGFAPVSGAYEGVLCKTSHRAPLIAFHAPTDENVPFDDGSRAVKLWAETNHCTQGPAPSRTFGGPNGDAGTVCLGSGPGFTPPWSLTACKPTSAVSTCETWDGCDNGGKVTFCSVDGSKQLVGGHILYINDTRLSIAAVAWDFFKQIPASP